MGKALEGYGTLMIQQVDIYPYRIAGFGQMCLSIICV